jgi:Ca-activated chloride channel homolog
MIWSQSGLLLLIPLTIALVAYFYFVRRRVRPSVIFSQGHAVAKLKSLGRVRFLYLPLALKVVGVCLLIAALARPQVATTKIKKDVEGIDILLVLDISDSMLIEDMQPENRLVAAKQMMKQFIEARISDRLGLVVFSGEAFTRVPLTLDYKLLLQSLSEVQTTRNIKLGTAIGVALASGTSRLKDSKAKSRVMVFMTDGENNSGTIDPETALEVAKEYGVKIYTIGIGRDGQAQLPVYIEDGRGNRIKQYRPMHSQVNEALLSKFADETGGKFWRATTGDGLGEIFRSIDSLEKTKIDVNQVTKLDEKFMTYLSWGLLALSLGFILGRGWLQGVAE